MSGGHMTRPAALGDSQSFAAKGNSVTLGAVTGYLGQDRLKGRGYLPKEVLQ